MNEAASKHTTGRVNKKVSIGYFDIISVVEIMGETFLF